MRRAVSLLMAGPTTVKRVHAAVRGLAERTGPSANWNGDRWTLTDEYADLSNEDIVYFGNLPYDVLSGIGSSGAYYYGRVRYAF